MRPLLGWVLLHAAVIATGLVVLRAFGWWPTRRRGMVSVLGPALLIGIVVVVPALIVLLVVGVPLNLLTGAMTCVACAGTAETVRRSRTTRAPTVHRVPGPRARLGRLEWLGVVAAGGYAMVGVVVFARLPTVWDDARIWSLRGMTIAYYHQLQPAIFQTQSQSGGHPVYPLLLPGLEALLFQAMGGPQLRFFHVELWLVFIAGVWTAVHLIRHHAPDRARRLPLWLGVIAVLALTPALLRNIEQGYVDATASVLLGVGALALALWLETADKGLLGVAAVLLAAAASTKDEDLIASALIIVVGAIVLLARDRSAGSESGHIGRGRWFAAAVAYFVVIVLPWRVWVAAHHLTDSVQPPLGHALSPSYLLTRGHQLHQVADAMLHQILSEWGGAAGLFIAACVLACTLGHATRLAGFYLATVGLTILALLWLYSTTPLRLSFLLPTSMNRTVDVFMVLATLGTAHLAAALSGSTSTEPGTPGHPPIPEAA